MGYNTAREFAEEAKVCGFVKKRKPAKKVVLQNHPNFKMPTPRKAEGPIGFALRCAAHLVSPPMVPGESSETECTDVAQQIRDFQPQVEKQWKEHRP